MRLALLLILVLTFVGCGSSSLTPPSETMVIPPAAVTRLNDVHTAELSPDGKHLLFDHSEKDRTPLHIYVCNADGTQIRRITNSAVADFDPSWSPDGKRIIFVRAARYRPYSMGGMVWDNMDLWTVNADGGHEIQITNSHFYQAGSPHFSPDQQHVVFWAYHDPPSNAPMGEPGTDDVIIGDFDRNGFLAVTRWMPITPGPDGSNYFAAENRDPAFSPDGSTIIFISNRAGNVSPYDYEVWRTDSRFTHPVQLTHMHTVLASPAFTNDGQHILFTAPGITPAGEIQLWSMKADGSDIKRKR